MKILVIGTSNTIVRGGWFDGFISEIGAEVERIALGGAPFVQFFSVLREVSEARPDHIILECAANDESYAQHIGSDIFVDRLYFMLLSSLRAIAPTTILRIPPESTLHNEPNIFKRQKSICHQLGCDVYNAATTIIEASNNTCSYRDKHHPKTEIAYDLGRRFCNYLLPSLKSPRKGPSNVVSFLDSVTDITIPRANLDTTNIETSLLKEEFALLTPGSTARLQNGVFALGFYINSGRSTGVLRLEGPSDSKDIFCYYTSPSNKNVKRFVPIRNGMNLRQISCVYAHNSVAISLHTDLFLIPQEVSLGTILCLDVNNQLS